MTKQDQEFMNEQKPTSYTRVPMEPLYERLLKKPFPDSVSAIEYCRSVCAEFGFTVKQEASANRNIYVYCSREGLPDSQRNPKPSPQRKRPSKRCDCRWRVVLSENEHEEWEFRKSMNPNASEHNHDMMSPEEMVKAWPAEVNEMIIQLARQRLQTHEIREAVKQQFPDISWNERRFYNRLTEERKRIRQRGVVERSQRLLMLSARLCSVIASNEEWALCVESDLQRMFENFCQLARLTPENISTLVDLQADMIQMDTDRLISNTHRLSIGHCPDLEDDYSMASPAKKRRSFARSVNQIDTSVIPKSGAGGTGGTMNDSATQKGIQMVYVPSYTIQVRSLLNRSCSESSNSSGRRVFNDTTPFLETQQQNNIQQQQQQQQPFASSSSFFSLASPTSSSSSSSSMPVHRHQIAHAQQTRVTSPQQSINSPSEFMMSQSYQTPQPHNEEPNYSLPNTNTANTGNYNMQASFSPYTIPTSAFTSPPELPFAFEPNMMRNNDPESSNGGGPEDRRQVFNFFPNNIKEEPSHVEQQQMLQRQQQDYEQRMHRTFTQQQGYGLPMIRSNEDPDEANTHWS
ncbi:hypothetical protein EDC94DRAFT_626005 [Helicostylum pulchrum]|nr:hypothetical protein EDC94DRAFT_626005 [Helicostylum pulchrum]